MKFETSKLEINGKNVVANGEPIPLASIANVKLELSLHRRIFAKKLLKIFNRENVQVAQLVLLHKPNDEAYLKDTQKLSELVTELFEKLPNAQFEVKPSITAIKISLLIIALAGILGVVSDLGLSILQLEQTF